MKRHRDGQRGERQGSLEEGVTPPGAPAATSPPLPASGAVSPAAPTSDGLAGSLAWWSNRGWLPGVLLVLATVLVYQPAWQGGLLWDDDMHITNNRMLVEPGGLKQIWSSPDALQYYPLVFTSFRFERALWGLHPAGYHWVNLLLHAASAVLVWRVLRRLKVPGAWLAGAVFALHPVNVESVAWISQRKNTLSMFFYLLSLLLYLRFDEQAEQCRVQSLKPKVGSQNEASRITDHAARPFQSSLLYGLSLGAFVLALLSKTAVAPLPLVLLGLAWWRRGRVTGRDVWRSAPFFVASLVLGLVTIWFERHQTAAFQFVRDDSFWSRLAVAGRAVWFYLYKALLPLNVMPIYPRWQIDPSEALSYAPGALAVGVFLLLWRYRGRWGRVWLFCAGYYVAMLLPVLGFVNIGFMSYSLVADHWQYFAMIAPIAAVSAGVAMGMGIQSAKAEGQSSKSRSLWPSAVGKGGGGSLLGVVVCGAVLAGLGGLTWRQSAIYANAETLWRATVAANPDCSPAHYALGVVLFRKGIVDEAIVEYQKALQIKPDYEEARNNLGFALLQKGRVDEAVSQFQKALERIPYNALAHFNLGAALLQKGKTDEAIAQYQEALVLQAGKAYARYNPELAFRPNEGFYADAHYNLGNAFLQKARLDEAIAQYQKALQLQPGDADIHSNLGVALLLKGRQDEAIAELKTALRLKPDEVEAQKKLADALLKMGRAAEALPYCEAVVKAEPGDAHAHFILGSACLAGKRPEQAVASYKEALRLAPDTPECMNALAWIYATCPKVELRNCAEAVRLAEQACKLTQRQKTATLDTLAAAYAEAGRFNDAVRTTEEIRARAVSAHDTGTADTARQRLELYKAGRAYRDE